MPTKIFNEGFVLKINSLIESNVYLYFAMAILCYSIGGIDEKLGILAIFNFISLMLAITQSISTFDKSYILKHIGKSIHLIIMLVIGVLVDKILELDSTKVLSLRNYLILYFSHRELSNIYIIIKKQGGKFPFLLKQYIKIRCKKESEY